MDRRLPTKVLEGHSPVNRYELLALEQLNQGLTEERMVLAFQALDELVPKLGVYSKLFSRLRDDFFKAVYSNELTGVSDSASKEGGTGFIQRLPYFILVKRVYDERHELTEELKEQLDIVKKRLFDKHQQFEGSQSDVSRIQEHIEHLNGTMQDLQDVIQDKDAEISRLEQEIDDNQKNSDNMKHQFECDITDLKDSLNEAKQEIEFLSQFKKGYDDMYYAFMDKESEVDEIQVKKKQKPAVSTKYAYTLTDIESANKMEDQILTVLNTAVEEFDKFLEGHKQELAEKVVSQDMTEAEVDLQEIELNEADQELEVVQQRFELTVSSMLQELELLRKHNNMLVEQMQTLEEHKPAVKKKDTGRSKGSEKGESILWAGLDEDEQQEEVVDPFIPQERVFSKYAAMVYTSNNAGKTFEEFKDAKYCPSCGEKTVVCPHKMGGSEKIFNLPHNCTHIKIARPKVRINREFAQMLMKPQSPEPTFDLAPSVSSNARSYQSGIPQPEMAVTPGTQTSHDSPSYGMMGEDFMVHTMQRVWDDYRRRTNLERSIPRPLSLDRARSLLEQFCAYIVYQDDYVEMEYQTICSILDVLYNFMGGRYLVEDVMFLATHDFLSSIIEYSGIDKTVQLLGHVLVGNLDASCLRYVLLMADFINQIDWECVEDFRAFASVVYPFLTEDDLESLTMSYTSFSENRISKQLVCNFLIHAILKYREPRFLDLENKLLPFASSESGQLSDREHKDALDSILPLCNERVRRRLFLEAEKAVMVDGMLNSVPIMRLAQISGYLALQQITAIIRENIKTRVAEWRERPSSAGSNRAPLDVTHGFDTNADDQILTQTRVKTLAANLARMAKHREERQNESYEDGEYGDDEEEEGW